MDTLCKKLLWLALVLVLGQYVTAQEKVSKKISRNYDMTNAGEMHLENKYGNINLYGWEKDEVSVVMNIVVTHRKKENAADLLKRISPVIREGNDYVGISYEIKEKSSSFFGSLFEKANPFDFDRSNIQIDYTVHMPHKAELEVKNTFGDIIIEGWTGKLKADVEHGDLWINEDLNRADINSRYGKLRTRTINYGNISLKNGSLDMEASKNLKLTSSGAEISIEKVVNLEIYSSKDEVELEEVGTIYGTLKFTNIELNRLTKDIDLTMKIADFRVAKILDSNADIAIEQESSEISLNITDFPLTFNAILEQGLVRLPKSFSDVESRIIDKGKRIREIDARYGKNPKGKVSISGLKGVILLKEL